MFTIQRNLCTKLSLIIDHYKSELLTTCDELGPQRRISIHKRSSFITSQQIYKSTLDKCWISIELRGVTAHILKETIQKWKVLVGITSKLHFYAKRVLWLICWELFNYIEKSAVDSSQHKSNLSTSASVYILKIDREISQCLAISAAILFARSMHSLRENALIECACYH